MPESNEKPFGIQVINIDGTLLDEYLCLDTVIKGQARIYGRYNIQLNECYIFENKKIVGYVYDEGVLYWTLPNTYVVNNEIIILDINSRESVESCISANSFEIMGSIKQSNVSW